MYLHKLMILSNNEAQTEEEEKSCLYLLTFTPHRIWLDYCYTIDIKFIMLYANLSVNFPAILFRGYVNGALMQWVKSDSYIINNDKLFFCNYYEIPRAFTYFNFCDYTISFTLLHYQVLFFLQFYSK